ACPKALAPQTTRCAGGRCDSTNNSTGAAEPSAWPVPCAWPAPCAAASRRRPVSPRRIMASVSRVAVSRTSAGTSGVSAAATAASWLSETAAIPGRRPGVEPGRRAIIAETPSAPDPVSPRGRGARPEGSDWTRTSMVPPHMRPTAKASLSLYPNLCTAEAPVSSASSQATTTAPSTQPPVSEPRTAPVPSTSIDVPTGSGAEPSAAMIVPIATAVSGDVGDAACRSLTVVRTSSTAPSLRAPGERGAAHYSTSRSCSISPAISATASELSLVTVTCAPLSAPSAMMSMAAAASSSAIEISMSSSYFSAASAMMPAGRACRPSAEPTVTVTLGMVSPRGSGCPVAASGGGSGGHGGGLRGGGGLAPGGLGDDHQDGSHQHAREDRHDIAPHRVDGEEHEDPAVGRVRLDRERHDERAGHGSAGHHRRDHAERVGGGERDGALGDEARPQQECGAAVLALGAAEQPGADHGGQPHRERRDHAGGHDRGHDPQRGGVVDGEAGGG